jgi:hypothetical protein
VRRRRFSSAAGLQIPEPLPGLGPILSGFAVRLIESRMECTEALIDSCLMLGRHRELIGGCTPSPRRTRSGRPSTASSCWRCTARIDRPTH